MNIKENAPHKARQFDFGDLGRIDQGLGYLALNK